MAAPGNKHNGLGLMSGYRVKANGGAELECPGPAPAHQDDESLWGSDREPRV